MINEKVGGKTHLFSHSNLQRFIANYLDKFAWVCIFIVIAVTILKVGCLSSYGIITLIFLCIIPYLYGKILQKVAYKIVVDFESCEVQLSMYRSDAIITTNFDGIRSIRVNGYIIFVLKERKVFYNDLQNNELLKCLNKIKKIHWGKMCALWGPSKNIRDTLES